MKLPVDSIIAFRKVKGYLLSPQADGDKSLFLARAGYSAESAEILMEDLRRQILPLDAEYTGDSEYGKKFRIRGSLRGPNGMSLAVVTVWMTDNEFGLTKFVTLFPDKK